MRVNLHAEAGSFLARAEPLSLSDPFSTNVIAVTAARVVAGTDADGSKNLWVTVEEDDGRVLGLAMQTPPHNLFVSLMPVEATTALAQTLAGVGRDLPGVNGAVGSTAAFAEAWEARTGQQSRVVTAMRLYRLGVLAPPRGVRGQAVLALSPDHLERVTYWFSAFHNEAQPHAPLEDWAALAEWRVNTAEVHLWQADGDVVALAAVSRAAAGVARVGPVYTPLQYRRRGYGGAVTAAATRAAVDAGATHVALYTDLANPISNSIYQAIGYQADHDAEERVFSRGRLTGGTDGRQGRRVDVAARARWRIRQRR